MSDHQPSVFPIMVFPLSLTHSAWDTQFLRRQEICSLPTLSFSFPTWPNANINKKGRDVSNVTDRGIIIEWKWKNYMGRWFVWRSQDHLRPVHTTGRWKESNNAGVCVCRYPTSTPRNSTNQPLGGRKMYSLINSGCNKNIPDDNLK